MREYKGEVGKRSWKTKVRVGGVRKYMSGEEMDEHRRTSRTVCHRLVTPAPPLEFP